MKRVLTTLAFAALASFSLVGCGGSGEPANIMEGADQSAIQSYEEMVAADEAAMTDTDAADEVAAPEETAAESE